MEGNKKRKMKMITKLRNWSLVRGWVVLIPIVIVWIVVWIWPKLSIPPIIITGANGITQERTQTLYLLSSIIQGFSSILALVFTVSLIAYQLFASYSQRLYGRFFDMFTITYISGYIVVILFSLFLTIEPNTTEIKICLCLASTCLLILLPYILNLRLKFSANSLINDLEIKAINEYKPEDNEPESILIFTAVQDNWNT